MELLTHDGPLVTEPQVKDAVQWFEDFAITYRQWCMLPHATQKIAKTMVEHPRENFPTAEDWRYFIRKQSSLPHTEFKNYFERVFSHQKTRAMEVYQKCKEFGIE